MPYMKKLLHDALNEYFKDYIGPKWDGTHIEVSGPKYIDDEACFEVILENADGSSMVAYFEIKGMYNRL